MTDDPKDPIPDDDKEGFGIPVKEPTPEPDYFPEDEAVENEDTPST